MSLQAVQAILSALTTGINTRSIYPRAHPRVQQAASDLVAVLGEALGARGGGELTILVVGDELVVGDRPMRQATLFQESLLRGLERRGVERLTLALGLDPEEARALLDGLCGTAPLANSPHVTLGRVRIGFGSGEGDDAHAAAKKAHTDAEGDADGLGEADLEAARAELSLFPGDRKGSVRRLSQLTWHLLEALARSRRSLLLLAAAEGPDDRLFVHSVNVALLALAQARALGFEGTLLHEIGMAALLHDIGKLELPAELREPGREWTAAERTAFERHPELGAATLAATEGTTALAVLVAFEHHLRWDGEPAYPRLAGPRAPGLASQITAVADTWDVAISLAPEPGAAARAHAREVLVAAAGTRLDPFLAGHFLALLSTAGAPR
jgi:putative nucleotidyltransferase with HDIG domain